MRIERVQIEEGFLDGLDISFVPGLNVIIGERGTGKTSLIEVIRYCLGVRGYTKDSVKRSQDHALSILGGGQVTVTLSDGEREIHVTRAALDELPRASESFVRPIVFSQTEIETIGLQARGRMTLLDSFRRNRKDSEARESEASAEVRSFTAQAEELRREIDELSQQVEKISEVNKQISELAPQEQKLEGVSENAKKKKEALDVLSSNIAELAVHVGTIERFIESVSKWQSSLTSLLSGRPTLEPWNEGGRPDPLEKGRARVKRAKDHLSEALEELQHAVSEAESHLRNSQDAKLSAEERSRQLRKEVETLLQGAGSIVRRGQQLRERKAHLESLKRVLAERRKELKALLEMRNSALDQLDAVREKRFKVRDGVASRLTETLGPSIRVKVFRAGQYEAFAAAIADALRGSGLRYNELSTILSENVSPRELLEAVDTNDLSQVAEATGITRERMARALDYLRESDLGALATVAVEDAVALQLLDGADYKGITELSTGQRCTVVLPLVLRHTKRVLIVDQPEDHIDNAFIADTLIVSILARRSDGQIIFSSHNANIPVLGNADRVIQLGSDGKRGFPLLVSDLGDQSVVNAITTVMEGGAEAFERRAAFYRHYGSS